MSAILAGIKEGDEVILPSYTFVSTANAFVLRGAKVVFVDIRPDTMNIDENLIEQAITSKTRAIVPVHYAGVACEMDTIISPKETDNGDALIHELRKSGESGVGTQSEAESGCSVIRGCCKGTISGRETLFRASSLRRCFQ